MYPQDNNAASGFMRAGRPLRISMGTRVTGARKVGFVSFRPSPPLFPSIGLEVRSNAASVVADAITATVTNYGARMRRLFAIAAALLCGCSQSATAAPGDCISSDEAELARLVNEYRVANGLAALPVSRWLSATGQWHAWDLIANNPVTGACNLHSWSGARPDLWNAVCYTADHAQAAGMWAKPREISAFAYMGNGFELAAVAFPAQTPQSALNWWRGSPAHNAVILQTDAWAGINLRGLGTGMLGTVAVLWFGDATDTDVAMLPCATDAIYTNGFEG